MASNMFGTRIATDQVQFGDDFKLNSSYTTTTNESGTQQVNVMQSLKALQNDDPDIENLVNHVQLKKGQIVATADELTDNMYVLMDGKVNLVCTNNEGRRLVIATLDKGAIFGEGALAISSDPHIYAEAASPINLWVIPSSEAQNMTTQYPILGWGLLQTYGERLLQVENNLEDVAYKKLPERLASLLLELGNYENGLVTGVSHQALADHLGTYRETVSAILRDFKRQGLVELGYRRINLLDIEILKEEAGIWDW